MRIAALLHLLMQHLEGECECFVASVDQWLFEFAAYDILALMACVQAKVVFLPTGLALGYVENLA